jgi:hypothetical protein
MIKEGLMHHYLVAYWLSHNEMISVDDFNVAGELVTHQRNPELLAIVRQQFDQISNDAKFALTLVWNCPVEYSNILYSEVHGGTSPTRVKNYLYELVSSWSWDKVAEVTNELKELAENI